MAGVALGVKSITSGQYLDEMRKEVNAPLLDEQTGRIQNILVVDDEGNVRDSLIASYFLNLVSVFLAHLPIQPGKT